MTSVGTMQFGRCHLSTTVLPTGDVMISGGSGGNGHNEAPYVFAVELVNTKTKRFSTLANINRTRGYHSIALLLPDGRILIGGVGNCGGCQVDQNNVEFYKPPYLFKPDTNGGQIEVNSRPEIIGMTTRLGAKIETDTGLDYGENIKLTTSGKSIARVTLIKLGAVIDARNFDQNFNELSFST